ADRPVHPEPVSGVRLEVEVAPAVHLPAPHDGLAAHLAAANPVKRLVGIERVGVLAVVHEELAAVLIAGITVPLDELVPLERLTVTEAAELHLPRRHVLDVIARRIDRPAGLEHERLEPALAHLLGGPPARDAGPYDDGVEAGGGHQKSPGDARQRPSSVLHYEVIPGSYSGCTALAHPPVMPDPTTMASKLGAAIRSPPGTRASDPVRCTRCTSRGSPRSGALRWPRAPTCCSRTP